VSQLDRFDKIQHISGAAFLSALSPNENNPHTLLCGELLAAIALQDSWITPYILSVVGVYDNKNKKSNL